MEKKIYLIPIVSILVLSTFIAAKQLIADSYYRMAHHDGKDPNKAIAYLEKCVAIDSRRPLFRFSLGRTYLRKGLVEAAKQGEKNRWVRKSIDEFQKAIELEPSNSDYHFHLGLSYGSLGYPSSFYWSVIQDSFNRTVMLNPTDTHHLYSIGTYYLNEYDRLKNIDLNIVALRSLDCEKYKELSKKNYQHYFKKLLNVNREYLREILKKCFSVTELYADLKAVIRDTPYDHVSLARFLKKRKMWNDAEKEFKAAINLDPANTTTYFDFAYSYFERRDFKNAINLWQKQKNINPKDKTAYLYLAKTYVKLNRFDDAVRELRTLSSLYPENTNLKIKLIRILVTTGQLDKAIMEYHKAIGKSPIFSKEVYDSLCYHRGKGDRNKTIRILNKALSSARNG